MAHAPRHGNLVMVREIPQLGKSVKDDPIMEDSCNLKPMKTIVTDNFILKSKIKSSILFKGTAAEILLLYKSNFLVNKF